ncbi:hypothetical protein F5878DRAFT_508571, partial [Lentinula raphanica]
TRRRIRTFIDSGASEHCWVDRPDFVEYTEVEGQQGNSAIAGEAGKFTIRGIGKVKFTTLVAGTPKQIVLTNVKHMPDFGHNLISLSTL